jgi:hypothetical protein
MLKHPLAMVLCVVLALIGVSGAPVVGIVGMIIVIGGVAVYDAAEGIRKL